MGIALILAIANLLFRGIAAASGAMVDSAWSANWRFFCLLAAWTWAGSGFFAKKKDRPLSVVLAITILDSLILILFAVWSGWDFQPAAEARPERLFCSPGRGFLLILLTAILGLIFSALRELFFLKKTRQPGWYFKAMLVCFVFSFFAPVIVARGRSLFHEHVHLPYGAEFIPGEMDRLPGKKTKKTADRPGRLVPGHFHSQRHPAFQQPCHRAR